MGRGLVTIVIGVVMLVGGLTGNLTMRFVDSPGALAALGFVLIGVGVFRIVRANKQNLPPGGDGGGAPPPQG